MEITAIEPRRKRLSQIYIDGEPAFKLDTETVLRLGYRSGSMITDEELQELILASDANRAKEKAMYLLEHRSHSKKELEQKIMRAEGSREAAVAAVEKIESLGLLDDRKYAKGLASHLFNVKKYGRLRVRQELLQKGIDKLLIEEILETYEDVDTAAQILSILAKKYRDYRLDEKVHRRAIAALQRYGYRFDEIKNAMQSADKDEPDWDL